MDFASIQARDEAFVANTYGRFPVAIVSGSGASCRDSEGKTYIDLTSGIGVNALGFCDPAWAKAVTEQVGTLQHMSNLFYTLPCIDAAEKLCKRTGAKRVFFANSGAEANEGMIKTARKYSFDRYGEGRNTIVTLVNSFHGRTVTTLAATGQDHFHQYFYPFTEGFAYAPANDLPATLDALSQKGVCALMMEMVQGEGGVIPLNKAYVNKVADYCRAHDILLLVDEVQSGMGRTGTLFSWQQFHIVPDVCSVAKGLAGGLPIGGVLFFEKTQSVLGKGDHATTFGGNPVCCAGACAVLDRLTDEFLQSVSEKSAYLFSRLEKMPHVTGVSGLGLMIGVSFDTLSAKDVVNAGIQAGILTLTAKEKLRLLPPLTITMEELAQAMDKLEQVLGQR